jgi:hypothetical protein
VQTDADGAFEQALTLEIPAGDAELYVQSGSTRSQTIRNQSMAASRAPSQDCLDCNVNFTSRSPVTCSDPPFTFGQTPRGWASLTTSCPTNTLRNYTIIVKGGLHKYSIVVIEAENSLNFFGGYDYCYALTFSKCTPSGRYQGTVELYCDGELLQTFSYDLQVQTPRISAPVLKCKDICVGSRTDCVKLPSFNVQVKSHSGCYGSAVTLTYDPPQWHRFRYGCTPVKVTAITPCGLLSSCTFNVTVQRKC